MFEVRTIHDHYYLVASSEAEVIRWVKTICEVCKLCADTEEDQTGVIDPRSQRSAVGAFSGSTAQSENARRNASLPADPSDDRMGSLRTAALKNGLTVPSSSGAEDSPYVLLKNCFVKSRPFSQNGENVPNSDRIIKRQPSIPEETAPPPPLTVEMEEEEDDFYKKPPRIIVYDKSRRNLPLTQRSMSSEMVSPTIAKTYDVAPSRSENVKPAVVSARIVATSSAVYEDAYDHVPNLNAPRPSEGATTYSIASRSAKVTRKNSLPSETVVVEPATYDQLPRMKTTQISNTLPHRHRAMDVVDYPSHTDSNTYDRPPVRSRLNETSAAERSPVAISSLSLYDQVPNAPKTRTRNIAREEHGDRSGVRNNFISDRSVSLGGHAALYAADTIPRSAGAKYSGSHDTITPASFTAMRGSDPPQRRNTAAALAVSGSPKALGGEYIDVHFSDSADTPSRPVSSYRSKTLPRPPSRQPARIPLETIPDGSAAGIEYKPIDELKTRALQITKKEVETLSRDRP
ncbi:GRB2-associated-binding protein 1-like isoform X2 [Paramacrobiotus metropolitanus]|nr:GRB2-associated-binding protein 1-like isoform X2 [Paramacrobiotus metropolitanus]